MFYVEVRDELGALNNIEVQRLKDKLGTRQLPTAELLLDGTKAIKVTWQHLHSTKAITVTWQHLHSTKAIKVTWQHYHDTKPMPVSISRDISGILIENQWGSQKYLR